MILACGLGLLGAVGVVGFLLGTFFTLALAGFIGPKQPRR